MKMYLKALLLMILGVCTQCSKQEEVEIVSATLQFRVDDKSIVSANGRIGEEGLLASVSSIVVSIEDELGNLVLDLEQLDIIKSGDTYFSDALTLPSGNYNLTVFAYLNGSSEIVAATPLSTSELADYVAEPLPLSFSLGAGDTSTLNPEVLMIDENVGLEEIGYLQFGFQPNIGTVFPVGIRIFQNEGNLQMVAGQVNVEAEVDGNFWSKTFEIENSITSILLKGGYSSYTFSVEKAGYDVATVTISGDDLSPYEIITLTLEQSSNLVGWEYDYKSFSYTTYRHIFEYDEASRVEKMFLSYKNGDNFIGLGAPTNFQYSNANTVPTTILATAFTQNIEFDGSYPSTLQWEHYSNTAINYTFNLDYQEGLLTNASGENTSSTNSKDQQYNFFYDSDGDLTSYECIVEGEVLWEGSFEYYAEKNIYPAYVIHDLVRGSYTLFTGSDYQNNNRVILPWLITPPKKLIKSAHQHYFAAGESTEKIELVEFEYEFDQSSRPISGTVNWSDVKHHPDVIIEKRKNMKFTYE